MNLTTLLRVLVILEILLTAGGVTAEHFLESWKHAPWIYLLTQGAGLILIGFVALVPIASVANRMRWPFLNGWALAHGTFLIVVPVVSVI